MEWAIKDWIHAVHGQLVTGSPETVIAGVSTDSRTLEKGQMFVALRGPNFDGHQFCADAVKRGAAAVMIAQIEAVGTLPEFVPVILVEDTLAALGRLASAWRSRFEPMVAALSGSSGKTSTKDMLRAMIAPDEGLVTAGNLNNLIGVPLTVFGLRESHRVAVFELAMNQPGELAQLTKIVNPEIVALTNVGSAHVGNFGSLEDLRRAKAELIVHARRDAVIVLNSDCYGCRWIAEQFCAGRDIGWFGIEEPAHFRAEQIRPNPPLGYTFDLITPESKTTLTLTAFGRHNISNALCAATLGYLLELDLDKIYAGIEAFRPAPLRSEVIELGKIAIIADCYNANPDSVEAALAGLTDYAGKRRRIVILGDMLELGDDAPMAHRIVGQEVAERGIELFATTGDLAQWASWEAGRMGVRSGHFETKEELVRAVVEEIRPGDVILVKGSRRMAMEDVVEALKARL